MCSLYLLVFAFIAVVDCNSSEDGSLDKMGFKKTNCTCGWRGQVENKIIGGSLASQGEFPSQIRLYIYIEKTLHGACGGTILTEKYSLLAAHCLRLYNDWTDKSLLRVCYGKADTTGLNESDTLKVEKYHPFDRNYNASNFMKNDIALLKVQGKFEFGPNVGPACIPTVKEPMVPNVDTDVLAVGYGYTEWNTNSKPVTTEMLHKVHLKRQWDLKPCDEFFGHPVYNDNHICTLTPGKSVSSGDSGGPLYFYDKEIERYVIVGVLSFINGPPKACTIGGFTKVGNFRNWIGKVLSGEGEKMCMKL